MRRGPNARRKARPDSPLLAWVRQWHERPDVASLASRFDCSRSTIYGLLDGSRRPSLDLAVRIEHETKIPAAAWFAAKKE